MTEEIKNKDPEPGELDILILAERVILFFRKYSLVFLIALLAGIGTGVFFFHSLPKIYRSRLIAHSFLLTNQEEIQIIDNWNELLGKHEYAALAAIFNCRETILYPLKQIKGDEIQKVFTPNNPNGFLIEVTMTDIAILDELQPALVNGLGNNDYVKQRIALKRSNLTQVIDKTTAEIERLDSTRKRVEDIMTRNRTQSSSSIADITTLNRALLEMNDKLMGYKEELQFTNAVQVLQGFSKFKQPVGPKLFVWIFLGLVVFLPVAWLLTLVHSINQKLRIRAGKRKMES